MNKTNKNESQYNYVAERIVASWSIEQTFTRLVCLPSSAAGQGLHEPNRARDACPGWGAGQLEDELGRNGWLTVNADPAVIFDTPIDKRYDRAVGLLGIDPRMLSQEAGHA